MGHQCRQRLAGKQSRGIGADPHEGGMTEGELPGLAHYEIQGDSQNNIDGGKENYLGRVGVDPSPAKLEKHRQGDPGSQGEARILNAVMIGTKHV